jgi:hypothetical protein
MKLPILSGFVVLCVVSLAAQTTPTSTRQATSASPQTVTMSGCVSGGANSQPFVLSNPTVLPQTGAPTAGMPGAAGVTTGTAAAGATAQPPSTATGAGAPGAAGATSGTAGTAATGSPGAAGTSRAGSGVPGATGAAGATSGTVTGVPGATGAAGTTGTPGAPGATSALNGYRLSGTDMSAWAGQRVQIVGTVIPMANSASPTPGTVPMPELRVQSVQPVTGPCPQQ